MVHQTNTRRASHRLRALKLVTRFLLYLSVGALGLLFALPLIWLLSSSLKAPHQLFRIPIVWIPSPLYWQNYVNAVTKVRFPLYLRNTLAICVGVVAGSVLSNGLVAYGFSRIRWPGRDAIFGLVLATTMIPGAVTLVPLFITFSRIGWIDTYLPFIVPAFTGAPFFIFLLRQFFLTIPIELSEAAYIDGAGELEILVRVILPLCRPALATVALFAFLGTWGDYFGPLIYLRSMDKRTIALAMNSFVTEVGGGSDYGGQMAFCALAVLPVIVLFFFAQRTFIEGIALTGIKG